MSNNINWDVVANRGEDLRFPISSSSGFSSPFAFYPCEQGYGRTLQKGLQGFFNVQGNFYEKVQKDSLLFSGIE
ncbi:hypothetical protein [Falsibacillus pallidus]|uniref:hypothetical protein n=1 Tax=Falsibacillus pallidus TaxID=493781 RepID=UPI003D970CC1